MGANKFEKFKMIEMNRQDIKEADYNPRKISVEAANKLKKFLKNNGLWAPLIVNVKNNRLVSGHQRLNALDTLIKNNEYKLTVAAVDVEDETEIKGNIFLNNPSAQGEWDYFKLEDIHAVFPDIDFIKDIGFDASELDFIFNEPSEYSDFLKNKEAKKDAVQEYTQDTFKEAKNKSREKAAQENNTGDTYNIDNIDYQITFVFPNNQDKHDFMRKIRKDPKEKFLKSTILYDLNNKVYDLSVLNKGD